MADRDQHAYAQLVARLLAARRFGMHLDLSRVEQVLERLDSPQDRLRAIVQVAGTNGKGSTVAFVQSIARAAGLRVGAFTSPHLVRLSERFVIGGDEARAGELVAAGERVGSAESALGIELTFFEKLTAMAVEVFASRQVDVAVLEVGLGGRLDATTAVGAHIAAVTGVALDHQEYLGETLADIAREKAGIFRPGQRAVVGASGEPEATGELVARARAAGVAELTVIGPAELAAVPDRLALAGGYQRSNAACALAIASHLESVLAMTIDAETRARGLAEARLRGRLDRIALAPDVWIDGAHNPQAAEATATEIERLAMARPRVLLLAVSLGKDAAAIARALVRPMDAVVVSQSTNPRAMAAADLAAMVKEVAGTGIPIEVEPDGEGALARARQLAGAGSILAAGSLFWAGDILHLCTGEPKDPAELSDPVRSPG